MRWTFWENASPLTRRVMTIIILFIIAVFIVAMGTLTPMSKHEAGELDNELNKSINTLEENGLILQYIFGNNFMIALFMFVPIVGLIFGGYVLYNTGVVIAASAIANDLNPTLALLLLFFIPVAWLEFAAYSTAMAESIWLTRRIFQRRGKHELVNATKFISICAILLLLAAIIETALIT